MEVIGDVSGLGTRIKCTSSGIAETRSRMPLQRALLQVQECRTLAMPDTRGTRHLQSCFQIRFHPSVLPRTLGLRPTVGPYLSNPRIRRWLSESAYDLP